MFLNINLNALTMNPTTPLSAPGTPPTIAQLFGNDPATAQYIKHLPEQVQFSKPIVPRLDIGRTKKMTMERVHEYDRQLRLKYPVAERKRSNPVYSKKRLNSGTMGTFDAMLEMFAGYQNAIKAGMHTQNQFSVSPSGIASRRYKAVRSMNTIGNHLERLQGAGLFKMQYSPRLQKYDITWNLEILVALPDYTFREELSKFIVNKSPKLREDENFRAWQKRLNPSFFACSAPGSPQFLSMYLLSARTNNNKPLAEFVNMGETKFPTNPPSQQESKEHQNINGRVDDGTAPLGAKNSPADIRDEKSKRVQQIRDNWFSPERQKTPITVKSKEKINAQWLSQCVESAFFLSIGIFNTWWHDKIKSGTITLNQINTAKEHLRWWLINQPGIKPQLSYREYITKIMLPAIRNNRNATLKINSTYIPYLDRYFDPQWFTSDGSLAGFLKALDMWEKFKDREKQIKLRTGTKKLIKKIKQEEDTLTTEIWFLLRNPSEKNYLKSKAKIMQYKNYHLLKTFIYAILSSKILSVNFMNQQIFMLKEISK